MSRVFGRVPTVGTFRRFYVNSISNRWLSFSKRGGVDDPCCYSKKFDSLKNWNNRFFWIDASVCLLSTPWFNGTSVVKDPLPLDEAVDLPWVELLNDNRTLIRKYPETFLCLVGLSRSFIKTDVRPTLLYDNDEGRLERTLADNEVPLNTKTGDRVLSPSAQTISLVDHTIQDELNFNSCKWKRGVAFVSGSPPVKKAWAEGIVISNSRPSTTGKSPSALRRLSRQNEQADTGSGSVAPATEDVTSFSVTPTPERVLEDVSDDNVRTCPPSGHFVILSYVTADTDLPDSPQNLLDHVTPPGYRAALRNQHDVAFLDAVNINSAQHVCMISELYLRYKHEIMSRENFKKKFTDSVAIDQQRDAKIADMKARLEKSKAEAAEVIEHRKRVSDLESRCQKVGELANFHTENVGLVERVSALESERDSLKNQVVGEGKMREKFVSQQDATKRHAYPEFCWFQPSNDLDYVAFHSESVPKNREMLLSEVIPAIRQSSREGFVSAPTLHQEIANNPPVTQPHDDLFDTSILDKTGDV
ncbi:hypothetical protein Tco_0489399 [Tanacetum coccineum]